LLLHPSPRRVAFVGLGTGITAGAALHHAVERVVALEIVPDVVEAARDDFADVNAGVVRDPRVTVVIDDGRNHLAAAPGDYDVIVGDLLVPWRPAEAPLYTRAHFESVRRSLRAEGVFCQWLPLYQLSAEQLASLVRTFVEVFPRTTLWRGNFLERAPTLALVGHTGTRTVDPAAVDARVQKLAGHEGNPFLAGPAGFWLFLVGPVRPALPWLARAPLNTDDQPWVELAGPLPPDGPDGAAVTLDGIQPFLADVAAAPVDGTSLAALDPPHQAWRATGAALGRASRTPGPEGQAQVLEILRTLPAELRRALEIEP
jgi:spermidine synthase